MIRSGSGFHKSTHLDSTPSIRMEVFTSDQIFPGLTSEWPHLWGVCTLATPFQSPYWLVPWWKYFGSGDLRLITFRWDNRLVGLAPFYIYTNPSSGIRSLFLLGTGNTDYLDVLFAPRFEAACSRAMCNWILETRSDWDECDFQELPPDSAIVRSTIQSEIKGTFGLQEACPILTWKENTPPVEFFSAGFDKKLAYY